MSHSKEQNSPQFGYERSSQLMVFSRHFGVSSIGTMGLEPDLFRTGHQGRQRAVRDMSARPVD
jgi:hypothetical protein